MPKKKLQPQYPTTSLRLSTGSLQDISVGQLATLKAEACQALDARWRRDNLRSTRLRGRPSAKDHIVAACVRIQEKMLRRKKATLGELVQDYGWLQQECSVTVTPSGIISAMKEEEEVPAEISDLIDKLDDFRKESHVLH